MASQAEIDAQLQAIRAAIEADASGLRIEDIERETGLALNRRTLQRRLNKLIADGAVSAQGSGRQTRYVNTATGNAADEASAPAGVEQTDLVPLSDKGAAILRYVSQPVAARMAVAYDRSFLDAYEPNRSRYLSDDETWRLHELGTTDGTVRAAGTYALRILNRLIIDLSWNSSRLEGNTYSLLETQKLIEFGQSVEGKGPRDAQMILNHKAAIEFLVGSAAEASFERRIMLNLHALLADNLLDDPDAAGRLRHEAVGIGGSNYMPPEIPQIIDECFDELLAKAAAIENAFEQAFFIMVQLPYLQPFIDVNKRVSRLALNLPLIKHNLAPLSFIGVPDKLYTAGLLGVYERRETDLLKDVFLWAYQQSAGRYVAVRQTLGEPDPFRMRYRSALRSVVAEVILNRLDQIAASRFIAGWATDHISGNDRAHFIEVAETELLSLHEGNFARYRVRPAEFDAWQRVWRGETGE